MRCMNRNKVRFFYSLYEGRKPVTDEWGNVTGEYEMIYGNPKECFANISPGLVKRLYGNLVKVSIMTR